MTVPWPYPAQLDEGAASHLVPGLRMPEVSLPSTLGGDINVGKLGGAAVLFFYPWAGRPGLPNPPNWDDIPGAHGSTPEAEGFREHYIAYRSMGIDVLGVSGQATADQQEFAARLKLPFQILSDVRGALRAALRLPTFETGGVIYLKRLTLVIRDGRIERAVYPVYPPHTHAGDLLAKLPVRS